MFNVAVIKLTNNQIPHDTQKVIMVNPYFRMDEIESTFPQIEV